MTARSPILVTGSHRAGSTWVGRMIAAHPSVTYIHEPFNPTYIPSSCHAKFPYWYLYLSEKGDSSYYYRHLKNTIEFRFNVFQELRAIGSLKGARRALGRILRLSSHRSHRARPLLKDPIAFFSAEWLARTFDMSVVALIRHPAAFAYSLKRLSWRCSFSDLLHQPHLMEDYLYPFREQIREYAEDQHDIISEAALFWKLIHHVMLIYRDRHRDWMFVRHEDLSREPLKHFNTIFEYLDLDLTEEVRMLIEEYTDPSNPTEAPESVAALTRRDSRASILNWKEGLTESEIEHIKGQVETISREFYSESDW